MFERPEKKESSETFKVGDEIVLTRKISLTYDNNIDLADPEANMDKSGEEFPVGTKGVITMLPEDQGTVHIKLEGRETSCAVNKDTIKHPN